MGRLCERPGCSAPADATYGFDPDQLIVWLDTYGEVVRPRIGVLCRRHADAMVVPMGWMLDDRREPVPRLFRPPAARGGTESAAPARRARTPRGVDDTEQLVFDPTLLAAIPDDDIDAEVDGEIEGEVEGSGEPASIGAAPDTASEPEQDAALAPAPVSAELEQLLSVRGSLLARAFHGVPRER